MPLTAGLATPGNILSWQADRKTSILLHTTDNSSCSHLPSEFESSISPHNFVTTKLAAQEKPEINLFLSPTSFIRELPLAQVHGGRVGLQHSRLARYTGLYEYIHTQRTISKEWEKPTTQERAQTHYTRTSAGRSRSSENESPGLSHNRTSMRTYCIFYRHNYATPFRLAGLVARTNFKRHSPGIQERQVEVRLAVHHPKRPAGHPGAHHDVSVLHPTTVKTGGMNTTFKKLTGKKCKIIPECYLQPPGGGCGLMAHSSNRNTKRLAITKEQK
jgi:hypothetical protein